MRRWIQCPGDPCAASSLSLPPEAPSIFQVLGTPSLLLIHILSLSLWTSAFSWLSHFLLLNLLSTFQVLCFYFLHHYLAPFSLFFRFIFFQSFMWHLGYFMKYMQTITFCGTFYFLLKRKSLHAFIHSLQTPCLHVSSHRLWLACLGTLVPQTMAFAVSSQ
jgi:hypothetical protein